MGFLPLEIPASCDHQKDSLFRLAERKSHHFERDLCFMEGALGISSKGSYVSLT